MRLAPAVPVLLLALLVSGCRRGHSSADPPPPKDSPASPAQWLCRPDRPTDPCRSSDLTATEIRPDGSRVIVSHHPADHPKVDCFYVYPTVDLELVPGNHEDLNEARRQTMTTIAQAARFTEACALWVPLYRQVTLGTYLQPKETLERGLARAFSDIERAFGEFLAKADPTRKIVVVGHSQGAEMVVRVLRRFFDDDPALRARLLLAMPIGGDVDAPSGKTSGGTFKNIPACTTANETGCVVAYRTYAAGENVDPDRWAPPSGRETLCVDPSVADAGNRDEPHRFSRAYFGLWPETRRHLRGVDGITTPFVLLRDFYSGRCVRGPGGFAYLEASQVPPHGDTRVSPVDFANRRLRIGKLGLHVLDMQLAQGDLVDMVSRRARAR
jgi:hypothetical protein